MFDILIVCKVGEWVGEWVGGRPNLVYSPGPGLSPGTLDIMDLTWDLDLDLSLTT